MVSGAKPPACKGKSSLIKQVQVFAVCATLHLVPAACMTRQALQHKHTSDSSWRSPLHLDDQQNMMPALQAYSPALAAECPGLLSRFGLGDLWRCGSTAMPAEAAAGWAVVRLPSGVVGAAAAALALAAPLLLRPPGLSWACSAALALCGSSSNSKQHAGCRVLREPCIRDIIHRSYRQTCLSQQGLMQVSGTRWGIGC